MSIHFSIIILNYKTANLVIDCISSIYQFTKGVSFEIIVVDNFSEDNVEELLKEKFPDTTFLQTGYNAGFSRANNVGIKEAKGEFVLLLNSDTLFLENTLKKCLDFWENTHKNRKLGILGCKLLNEDKSLQLSTYSTNSLKKNLEANPIYILFNRKKNFSSSKTILHQHNFEIDWLSGAFLMMNREILLKEDFFLDEDFFMYSEDVELGYRVNSKGYTIQYFQETEIIHLGGGGSNVPLKRMPQILLSSFVCMQKTKGRIYFLANQMLLTLNVLLDEILLQRKSLNQKLSITDLRNKVIRKVLWNTIKKYSMNVLLDSIFSKRRRFWKIEN